ncbi:MAG TPA: phosphodiester glycosidase family protein [Candidatus Eisenbacteria bacterium]|nr:phosphodiester glycosidase family protein [Candidatus Eisenbacteria bacterium]
MRSALTSLLVAGLVGGLAWHFVSPATAAAGGGATLSVRRAGAWHVWWRADQAPARWSAPDTTLSNALAWRRLAPGLDVATLRLACAAPAWRSKLVVARLDPRLLHLSLQLDLTRDQRPAWTIDRAPEDALLAVNAGQFVGGMPWGWVARDGRQLLRPGAGPLATAITIDAAGRVRWAHADTLLSTADAVVGFQSYPTLLSHDGVVPAPIRKPGGGVSHEHRDARLALGETRDGHLLIVLTRFDAMGEITGALPLGPTTPEMAAIMGALGSRDAVMLDGGISAQLLLRDPGRAAPLRWPGMRKVPLALIARARAPVSPRSPSPSPP